MPLIKVNHTKSIYYEEFGSGIPMICIHPPGMGRKVFYYQFLLPQQIRGIFPDLSGHGESDHVTQEVSISYYAKEIVQLMDALKINRAVLLGYSAGCLIAQHIGIHYSSRVETMILVGSYPMVNNFSGQALHKMGMYMVKKQPNVLIKVIARSHTKDQALRKNLIQHMKKTDKKVWYQYYHASLNYNCLEKLNGLRMPILIMYGEKGDWTSHYIPFYKNKCKHVNFFSFKHQSHQLPTKEWKLFNEQITKFIRNN